VESRKNVGFSRFTIVCRSRRFLAAVLCRLSPFSAPIFRLIDDIELARVTICLPSAEPIDGQTYRTLWSVCLSDDFFRGSFPTAPQFRKDDFTGDEVVIAPRRADRPVDSRLEPIQTPVDQCVFCPGQEFQTPRATFEYRLGDDLASNWQIRVVPNKYPIVGSDEEFGLEGDSAVESAIGRRDSIAKVDRPHLFVQPALGLHEVVIERSEHTSRLTDLTPSRLARVLATYAVRLRDLRSARPNQEVIIFRNQGRAAGASQEHSHAQLVAGPNVFPRQRRLERVAAEYRHATGRTLMLDVIKRERLAGVRLVDESPSYQAWCPFASRFPFEVRIAPKFAVGRFDEVGFASVDDDFETVAGRFVELAELYRRTLRRVERALESKGESADFNVVVHSAIKETTLGRSSSPADGFVVHLDVLPRIAGIAGYELGAGAWINPYSPERAADALRSFDVDE
jgi:UDPglucose--hexose-1-phosphate uridylyltransferase